MPSACKKVDLHPTICNICGGPVEYIPNSQIYHGHSYGSGWCYHCRSCGAYVGTHTPRPKEALGLLADEEMRTLKMACHQIFDKHWNRRYEAGEPKHRARQQAYRHLASDMGIPSVECHFGWFDTKKLKKALEILKGWREAI